MMCEKNENICRFCLKTVYNDNFKALEEVIKQMLNELFVKLNLNISEEPGVCTDCMTVIEKSFDFKLSYIYLKQNENLQLSDATDDQKICQFCTKRSEQTTCNILNNTMVDMLQKHIPEMNLIGIEKLVICEVCQDSLQNFLKFITKWVKVEEKIEQYMRVQGTDDKGQIKLINVQQFTFNPAVDKVEECSGKDVPDVKENLIKSEDITMKFKSENECLTGSNHRESDTSEEEIDTKDQSFQQVGKMLIQSKVSVTEQEEYIKMHMMIHKNPSGVTMYQCDICWYWTKGGDTLRHHVLKHLCSTKSKCEPCTTKPDRHVKLRKRPNVTLYRCDFCSYRTDSNSDYRIHMAEHENLTETIMYQCDFCSFQTKYKDYFKKHKVGHKNRSKTILYPCDLCLFQTRYKSYFTEHMKEHENSSVNLPLDSSTKR